MASYSNNLSTAGTLAITCFPATAGVPSVARVHVVVFFRHIAAAVSDNNAFAAMPFLFDICKVVWSCFISEMYPKLDFSASELAIFFLDSTVSVPVVRIFPSFGKLPKKSTSLIRKLSLQSRHLVAALYSCHFLAIGKT